MKKRSEPSDSRVVVLEHGSDVIHDDFGADENVMINDQSVQYNGKGYRWISPRNADIDDVNGVWIDAHNRFPDEHRCRELNVAFLQHCLPGMVIQLVSAKEARHLAQIVRDMGATDEVIDAVRCRDFEALGIRDEAIAETQGSSALDDPIPPTHFGDGTTPLDDIVLRDWLFGEIGHSRAANNTLADLADLNDLLHKYRLRASFEIATTGSGPFGRAEFAEILNRNGHEATLIQQDSTGLIVGRSDWDPDDLDQLIKTNLGRKLKIYSQEMYLLRMLFDIDLFSVPQLILERLRDTHPALSYIGHRWDG